MSRGLNARTAAGQRAALLAEEQAGALAARVAEDDRAARLAPESLREMAASGLLGACVPTALGGLGVDTLHDLAVVVNRLGRADAGTALAVHMQLAREWYFARRWGAAGDGAARDGYAEALTGMNDGTMITCGAASEAGPDHDHVLAEAVPVEGGYRVSGRKVFVTLSALATHFYVRVRVRADGGGGSDGGNGSGGSEGSDGEWRIASARIDRDAPGVTVVPGWDALGMRTSGSNDLLLEDVFVPREAVSVRGRWGVAETSALESRTAANVALQGVFLGCAEAARDLAVAQVAKGMRAGTNRRPPGVVHVIGEMEVKLATATASLRAALTTADDALRDAPSGDVDPAVALEMMVAFQCAKDTVTTVASDVVNLAMTIVGGGAYMSAHPLSRIYRDVRAGAFMQPYAPLEALDFIGRAALEREGAR
ncbi:acyl-CoA dehydrogenase family protein [Streptomyces sp. URMC 123]|uniref:acyl-CoA dehydrogenase family protein n=1 Tax=Streptomyces sp. URMC 123 TaxID=3423403 RepID=UPI003F1DC1F6